MGIMRSKDCDDPLSWYYQGAIHLLPDSVVGNPLCDMYQNQDGVLAWDGETMPGWNQCTHIELNLAEEYHFLVWHRFYIWHFERIVRELSGKEDFALPYWNYVEPTQRTMPEIFWSPANQDENPLYSPSRWHYLNEGNPFPEESPDSGSFQIGVMLNTTYQSAFSYTQYETFNRALDDVPHGIVHGSIGGAKTNLNQDIFNPIFNRNMVSGLMSDLASAGFDPIFWVHHANIDRLWEQWNRSGNGALISLDTLKKYPKEYLFFDEKGDSVRYSMDEVFEQAYSMDYVYDDVSDEAPLPTTENATPTKRLVAAFAGGQEAVSLSELRTSFKLVPYAAPEVSDPPSLDDHLSYATADSLTITHMPSEEGQKVVSKVIVGSTFYTEPEGLFHVFANLPEGYDRIEDIPVDLVEKHLIGVMNFFGNACRFQNDGIPICGTFPTSRKDALGMTELFASLELEGQSEVNISILKTHPGDEISVHRIAIVDGVADGG